MQFLFSEDQETLRQGVKDYFAGTHGPEVLRRLDTDENRDPQIWQGLVTMGLPGLLVPEEHGGLGLTLLDAALIASECGRVCLAEPLVDTAFIAVPWLVSRSDTADLSAIALGHKKVALAHIINGWSADGEGEALCSVDPLRNLSALPADASSDGRLVNLGALMSAAQLIGLSEAMIDQTVEYAKMRHQFGQPIGAFQAVKHQSSGIRCCRT